MSKGFRQQKNLTATESAKIKARYLNKYEEFRNKSIDDLNAILEAIQKKETKLSYTDARAFEDAYMIVMGEHRQKEMEKLSEVVNTENNETVLENTESSEVDSTVSSTESTS